MERVGFSIYLDGSDYERRCVSRAFLAYNREEIVFLFVRLQRVLLDYQGQFSLPLLRGAR